MIPRDYYIELIEEIRNVEKISIDSFIEEKLEPLMKQDNYFVETLYKDIHYLIKDIDKEGENDLAIENGSLVIESDGLRKGIKLTGYQSRLHQISIWLHMQIVEKFMQENPLQFIEKMEDFEKYHLNKPNYTPEYKAKLDKIKESLMEEREQNLNEKKPFTVKLKKWFKRNVKVVGSGVFVGIIALLALLQQCTEITIPKILQGCKPKQEIIKEPVEEKIPITYQGSVLDNDTRRYIAGAEIAFTGYTNEVSTCQTDDNGLFHIQLPKEYLNVKIKITHRNYEPKEFNRKLTEDFIKMPDVFYLIPKKETPEGGDVETLLSADSYNKQYFSTKDKAIEDAQKQAIDKLDLTEQQRANLNKNIDIMNVETTTLDSARGWKVKVIVIVRIKQSDLLKL